MQRRIEKAQSPKKRLLAEAQNLRNEAALLPHGPLRDAALKAARHAEAAAHMEDWINSPGLRAPVRDDPGRDV